MSQADNRRGEIAYEVLKYLARRFGLSLDPRQVREELGKISKATGISMDELLGFGRKIGKDLTDEVFSG